MVKKNTLTAISAALAKLCESNGITTNLEVVNFFDSECDVRIPNDLANLKPDELSKVAAGLSDVPGVEYVYDRGAGRKIRGNDYRQFEIIVQKGHWTHTEEDEVAIEKVTRAYFDEDEADRLEKDKEKARERAWEDYYLEPPEPDGNPNTELYLTMAYQPYDWIDKGYVENGKHLFKRVEFRAYNEYYNKKLLSHPIKTVKFQRGYGGPGRGKPQQMRFVVKGISLWDPVKKVSCDPRHPKKGIVPVFFAIDLGERLM